MKTQSLAGYHDMLLYYKQLNIISDEKEFEDFSQVKKSKIHKSKCLLKELPINFRINKTRPYWKEIENRFISTSETINKDTGVLPLRKLEILGEEIFKFEISAQELKKNPSYNILHKILLEEALMNNIFRQESVSMLPVSLLKVNHESTYLDMCAAPGSKTLQIVENIIKSQLETKAKGFSYVNPKFLEVTGFVVANELDSLRSNMLAFQTIKLPQNFLMITNQDACTLPDSMKFDKILCDVPCSGDGTIRKNDMIKKGWSYKYGLKLHPLQLRILVKGLNLLKDGGELIYSTCSLNPIEDESVVNEALRLFGEDLELVDISENFKEFKVSKGIKDWKVYFKRGKKELNQDWFENHEQAIKMRREDKITKSMFPNNSTHPLDRTVRILPHQNDTGGFYIAHFKKKTNKVLNTVPLPDSLKSTEEEKIESSANADGTEAITKSKNEEEESKLEVMNGNELVRFAAKYPDEWISIKKFYAFGDNYDGDFYFLNKGLKRLLYINKNLSKFVTDYGDNNMRIVTIGSKVFERLRDEECETGFRVLNEALYWMLPEFNAQIITVSVDTFKELVSNFEANVSKVPTDSIKHGPFMITSKARDLALIAWKGRKRLTLLIGKEELHFLSYFLKSNFYTLE